MTTLKEKDLYPSMELWVKSKFECFDTATNTGTEHGRVDVLGLRQTPGDHSSDTDLICIEVKRGTQPFLNALGQALGYSIYGNYCYLADYRPKNPYSDTERVIAEQLGVGLIRIQKLEHIELVSTARRCTPIENLKLQIADQIGYVRCTICSTFFPRSRDNKNKTDWSLLQRDSSNIEKMVDSVNEGKGLVFWPKDASQNDKSHDSRHRDKRIYNRRFMCNTCSNLIFY
jgi:hypothetical protein